MGDITLTIESKQQRFIKEDNSQETKAQFTKSNLKQSLHSYQDIIDGHDFSDIEFGPGNYPQNIKRDTYDGKYMRLYERTLNTSLQIYSFFLFSSPLFLL